MDDLLVNVVSDVDVTDDAKPALCDIWMGKMKCLSLLETEVF